MSDLGSLSYYLRIEVCQMAAGITISEGAYTEKILDKARLGDCNPSRTPLPKQVRRHTEGRRNPLPEPGGESTIPCQHEAGPSLLGWIREQIHGGAEGRASPVGETHSALHR
jgi:hypothetical protein